MNVNSSPRTQTSIYASPRVSNRTTLDECEKYYKFGRILGQGTFATVKLATSLKDKSKWAIKVVKRSALSHEDEESLKMEIKILELTNHPNIVAVKEVFYSRSFVYLVMDLMTGGELFDRIVLKDHYSEEEAKVALWQIVNAIKYCHEKNIVHRDLKPENILYASQEENSTLKLADFGLACLLKPNQSMHVACGTPGYVAPEILKGQVYGKEVDMWSIGVILYILLCGFPPFYDDNNKKLFSLIVHADYSFPDPYWTDITPRAKDLVTKLLVLDPSKRLTASQVLEHEWLTEVNGSKHNLVYFKENLTSYNARRRLRAAIRAVQITQLFNARRLSAPSISIAEVVEASDNMNNIMNQNISDQNNSVAPDHKSEKSGPGLSLSNIISDKLLNRNNNNVENTPSTMASTNHDTVGIPTSARKYSIESDN
eukprot:gene6384-8794_t